MNRLQENPSKGNTTKTESLRVRVEVTLCSQWSMLGALFD